MAIRAEFGSTGMGVHGAHRALHGFEADSRVFVIREVADPHLAQLQVDHVAFFQVDDLVGDAGQGHGVGSQKVFAAGRVAHTQHQRRTFTCTDHAMGFVAAEHGNGISTFELAHGALHSVEQIAVVQMVDEVGNDLGVGLAGEGVALGHQGGAQFVVVFNDAVVHQGNAARDGGVVVGVGVGAVRKMWVGVVHCRHAVGGPAGMGNAGA